jgi:hypothetical protein
VDAPGDSRDRRGAQGCRWGRGSGRLDASRVARILEQLNNAWDVLRTMTPTSSNGWPIIRAGCSISRRPRPCGSTPWRASFPPSHAAKFDAEPSIPSTICRPRSHATSTPTTAILDRSYGPLPPKQSPAAYGAETVDHAERQRDQIAALAVRAGLSVIDAKAAGVIAIVSIGPNMGTAPAGR